MFFSHEFHVLCSHVCSPATCSPVMCFLPPSHKNSSFFPCFKFYGILFSRVVACPVFFTHEFHVFCSHVCSPATCAPITCFLPPSHRTCPQLFFLFFLVWNFTFMCGRVFRVFRSRVLCLLVTCFPVTRSPAMSQKFPSFSLTLWDFGVPCGRVFRVFRPRVLCLLVTCFPVTRSLVACSPVTCSLPFSHGNSQVFSFLFLKFYGILFPRVPCFPFPCSMFSAPMFVLQPHVFPSRVSRLPCHGNSNFLFSLTFMGVYHPVWPRVPCFPITCSMFSAHTCVFSRHVFSRHVCPSSRVTEIHVFFSFSLKVFWFFIITCGRVCQFFHHVFHVFSSHVCSPATCSPVTCSPPPRHAFFSFLFKFFGYFLSSRVVACAHVCHLLTPANTRVPPNVLRSHVLPSRVSCFQVMEIPFFFFFFNHSWDFIVPCARVCCVRAPGRHACPAPCSPILCSPVMCVPPPPRSRKSQLFYFLFNFFGFFIITCGRVWLRVPCTPADTHVPYHILRPHVLPSCVSCPWVMEIPIFFSSF